MPKGVYKVMKRYIKLAIDMLAGYKALPQFLDVPSLYRLEILRVLGEWQEETLKEYPTRRARINAVDTLRESKERMLMQRAQLAMSVKLDSHLDVAPTNPQGLFDHVMMWFTTVVVSLGKIKNRLKIEVCVGDVAAVLEQIRYGVVGHRKQAQKHVDAADVKADHDLTTYPQVYDRIHLSNILDYIGGTLSSYLYAIPKLRPGKEFFVTSTNLRNPRRFDSLVEFDNEYVTLSAPADLATLFNVRMDPVPDGESMMPTCYYNTWHHEINAAGSRMSRTKLETWLQRIFFKIIMPKEKQQISDQNLILSPLNVTIFFRQLVHLADLDYPGHWLSSLWAEILSGKIVSRARPPRSGPLALKEVAADHPALEQSLAPFTAELTTLTALWLPVLPFGIPSPGIPLIQDVHKYSFTFGPLTHVPDTMANIPTFILAFHKMNFLVPNNSDFLRPYVLSDETVASILQSRKAHKEGLHVVTTWHWDSTLRRATFWMRNEVMEKIKLKAASWSVAIWRTDNWERHLTLLPACAVHDHGVWVRGEDVPAPDVLGELGQRSRDYDPDGDMENPHMEFLQRHMEMMLGSMPGDSPAQRMQLVDRLMGRMQEMDRRR